VYCVSLTTQTGPPGLYFIFSLYLHLPPQSPLLLNMVLFLSTRSDNSAKYKYYFPPSVSVKPGLLCFHSILISLTLSRLFLFYFFQLLSGPRPSLHLPPPNPLCLCASSSPLLFTSEQCPCCFTPLPLSLWWLMSKEDAPTG